jgi:hypothetical protein
MYRHRIMFFVAAGRIKIYERTIYGRHMCVCNHLLDSQVPSQSIISSTFYICTDELHLLLTWTNRWAWWKYVPRRQERLFNTQVQTASGTRCNQWSDGDGLTKSGGMNKTLKEGIFFFLWMLLKNLPTRKDERIGENVSSTQRRWRR